MIRAPHHCRGGAGAAASAAKQPAGRRRHEGPLAGCSGPACPRGPPPDLGHCLIGLIVHNLPQHLHVWGVPGGTAGGLSVGSSSPPGACIRLSEGTGQLTGAGEAPEHTESCDCPDRLPAALQLPGRPQTKVPLCACPEVDPCLRNSTQVGRTRALKVRAVPQHRTPLFVPNRAPSSTFVSFDELLLLGPIVRSRQRAAGCKCRTVGCWQRSRSSCRNNPS